MSKYTFTINDVSPEGTIDHIDVESATDIVCVGLNLTKLPNWPNVISINCSNNQLTELPNWQNVTSVVCSHNSLTELPNWAFITKVHCSHNRLTELPNWALVTYVYCSRNQLATLPNWALVTYVYCIYNNNIIKIPYLPKLPYTNYAKWRKNVDNLVLLSAKLPKDLLWVLWKYIYNNPKLFS
jgi:Leucine-rich repeat (LRR) protein